MRFFKMNFVDAHVFKMNFVGLRAFLN